MNADKLQAGEMVILAGVPDGLLAGLPHDDQHAISSVVGKPALFVGYDEDSGAEVEFTDDSGVIHSILLDPKYLKSSTPR